MRKKRKKLVSPKWKDKSSSEGQVMGSNDREVRKGGIWEKKKCICQAAPSSDLAEQLQQSSFSRAVGSGWPLGYGLTCLGGLMAKAPRSRFGRDRWRVTENTWFGSSSWLGLLSSAQSLRWWLLPVLVCFPLKQTHPLSLSLRALGIVDGNESSPITPRSVKTEGILGLAGL